jgi:hypothetical protein
VADQNERDTRVLASGNYREVVQVIDHMIKVGDESALAVGATVADVVVGVYGCSVGGKRRSNVSVAAAVLGVAMNDLDNALRPA